MPTAFTCRRRSFLFLLGVSARLLGAGCRALGFVLLGWAFLGANASYAAAPLCSTATYTCLGRCISNNGTWDFDYVGASGRRVCDYTRPGGSGWTH